MGQRSSGGRQKVRSDTEQEHSEAEKCFPAAGKTFQSVEKTFSDSEKASPVDKKVFFDRVPVRIASLRVRHDAGEIPDQDGTHRKTLAGHVRN